MLEEQLIISGIIL